MVPSANISSGRIKRKTFVGNILKQSNYLIEVFNYHAVDIPIYPGNMTSILQSAEPIRNQPDLELKYWKAYIERKFLTTFNFK